MGRLSTTECTYLPTYLEGMSSGCRLGVGGWGGPAVAWRPGGPIWSAGLGQGGASCGLLLLGLAGPGSCNV